MEHIAVFVDDAEYTRKMVRPMMVEGTGAVAWLFVACPPRMTHRIGKWVTHANRAQWREKWALHLRDQLAPLLDEVPASDLDWMVAKGPLDALAMSLRSRHGAGLRLLDARRPKLAVAQAPLTPEQVNAAKPTWATPVAVSSSLSLVLALTD